MGRETCHTCELLKELYWLKLNQFMLAARSASRNGHHASDEELNELKEESLDALRLLIRHAKSCYGLMTDAAA